MSIVKGWSTSSPLEDLSGRGIQLTTRRIAAAIIGLQAAVLAVVGVEYLGLEIPVLREVLAIVYLTFVPGYLVLRIAGIDPEWIETVLFSVGLSLVTLMGVGVFANFVLHGVGIAEPIAELPMVLTVAVAVTLLTWMYARRVDDTRRIVVDTDRLTSPLVLGLAILPIAGVYGALILTRFGNNYLLIALYAVVLAIPVLAIMGRIPDDLLPYAIWTIALALLLQNSLSGHFMAWGDSPKEAGLALDVLRAGYWEPSAAPGFGSKYTMLRIVILHPLYALFSDLQFVWVFKVVHPLIFSLTPVALYRAYERYTTKSTAFLSVFLYVSLFSFFIVLSRNTRTATAIFFLSLFAVLLANDRISLDRRKLLAMAFVAGVVVSHYGVSYMIMLALGLGILLDGAIRRFRPHVANPKRLTSPIFVGLYAVMLLAWYIYASPDSKAFSLLTGFAQTFINRLTDQFFADPDSTSASVRYLAENFSSTTLTFLRTYNILIGGIIGIGFLLTYWRVLQRREIEFDSEYLAYASVALAIFGITFLPVERFNTARTYPTMLLFFAPMFVIGIRGLLELARTYVPRFSWRGTYRVAIVALVAFLALNVGFVSATMTHEYSTNALVEKDRIMDDGQPSEKNYFYKQYPTTHGVRSTDWIQTVGQNDTTLYTSNWPGGLKGAVGHSPLSAESRDLPYFHRASIRAGTVESDRLGSGYVYLSAFNHESLGNVIRFPSDHFQFEYVRTSEAKRYWSNKSLVYVNGGSSIYR